MKIVQMIDSLGQGGAEKHVVALSTALRQQGFDVVVLSGPGHYDRQVVNHVNVASRSPVRVFWALRRIWKEGGQFDLLHVHSVRPLLAAKVFNAIYRVPIVFTVHGWTDKKLRSGGWLLRALKPNHTICVSADLADKFVERLGGSVTYVANGVPDRLSEESNLFAREFGLELVSVGRLAFPKNQIALIETVALLRNQGVDVGITLVGEGADRALLKRKARDLGIQGAIRMPGFVDPLPYLFRADIFVSSSLSEGLSLAHLEALMTDLPLVVSNTSGSAETVASDNGAVVNSAVAAEFSREILRISEELSTMETRSRKLFLERFTEEAMIASTVKVFEVAIAKSAEGQK